MSKSIEVKGDRFITINAAEDFEKLEEQTVFIYRGVKYIKLDSQPIIYFDTDAITSH